MAKKKIGNKIKNWNTNNNNLKKFKKLAAPILLQETAFRILQNREKFKEFWESYCLAYSSSDKSLQMSDLDDPTEQKRAMKRCAHIKCYHSASVEDLTTFKVEDDNDAPAIRYNKSKKKNDEFARYERRKIAKRRVQEISFASEITVSTVRRIQRAAEFKRILVEDYYYFLNGGTELDVYQNETFVRKRFNFQHLQISFEFRKKLEEIKDKLMEGDINNFSLERKNLKESAELIKLMIETTRDLDLQAVEFLNKIEEGEFSMQKVLQGAILNDRAMVENGQIILEKMPEAVPAAPAPADVDESLRKLGEAIFEKQIEAVSEKIEEREEKMALAVIEQEPEEVEEED